MTIKTKHVYPSYEGPNDGGEIWTEREPKAGDLYQDDRCHRYVFSKFLEAWIYVGRNQYDWNIQFRGAARQPA